jgi:hypothetical protein
MDQFYFTNHRIKVEMQENQTICAPMPSGQGLAHFRDSECVFASGSRGPKESLRAEKSVADPCSARETGHSSSFKSNYWLMKNATGPKPANSGTPSFNLLALRANTSITSRTGNPISNKKTMNPFQLMLHSIGAMLLAKRALHLLLVLLFLGQTSSLLYGQSCNNSSEVPPTQAVNNLSVSQNPLGLAGLINGFHRAGAGLWPGSFSVVEFRVSNTTVGWNNRVTFCIELEEPIGSPFFPSGFNSIPLENITRGRAGESGTATSAVPVGGIGAERAGKTRYLFDNYYQGTASSAWTDEQYVAFQLALWELTHDTDFSLTDNTGEIYISGFNLPEAQNSIDLAQSWLDAMNGLGFSTTDWENYNTTTWTVAALEHNVDPAPGTQDAQDLAVGESCDNCALNAPTIVATCDDNGTPSDPSDDTFSYTIEVTGSNTGATYSISGGDMQAGPGYNT